MFSEGLMGMLAEYFQDFVGLTPEAEIFLYLYGKMVPGEVTQWIGAILPEMRFRDFEQGKEDFGDAQVLELKLTSQISLFKKLLRICY